MKRNSKASVQRQERQPALDAKTLRQDAEDASDESMSTRAEGKAPPKVYELRKRILRTS